MWFKSVLGHHVHDLEKDDFAFKELGPVFVVHLCDTVDRVVGEDVVAQLAHSL